MLFGKEELEVRRQLGGGVARACHPRVQKKKKILYRKNSVILLNVGIILDINCVCKWFCKWLIDENEYILS